MSVWEAIGYTSLLAVGVAVLLAVIWVGIDLAAKGRWQAWLIWGPMILGFFALYAWLIWADSNGVI